MFALTHLQWLDTNFRMVCLISAESIKAFVDARKGGNDVQVLVDSSQEEQEFISAICVADAAIPVRTYAKHSIAHNEVVVEDGQTVEQGEL